MSANQQIAGLKFVLSANDQKFAQQMKGVRKDISGVGSTFKGLAATLGVAFGGQQIVGFALEVSKLAGQAEGVKAAFDRLPDSIKLMDSLKTATHGTVSELELMKRSVMASNFKINLEALPRLLEFATLRAQQTGQSVDYLVDSIVTGIGRKSALILDNLGISAADLREQLKETPDYAQAVAAIIEREMPKMGGYIENTASESAKLNAEWENLKVLIGEVVNKTGAIQNVTTELQGLFLILNNNELANKLTERRGGFFAALFPNLSQIANLKELGDQIKLINNNTQPGPSPSPGFFVPEGFKDKGDSVIETIGTLKEKIKELNDELLNQSSNSGYEKIKDQIEELEVAMLSITNGPLHNKSAITESVLPSIGTSADIAIPGGAEDSMNSTASMLKAKTAAIDLQEAIDGNALKTEQYINSTMMFSETIGGLFADLSDGTMTAAQAIGRASSDIIRHIGKIIMAEMVLAAIKDKTTSVNFFAKLALVGVAFSAGAAILSKLGSSGGGSAGVSHSGGSSSQRAVDQGIKVQGNFKLQGSTLVAGIDKANYQKSRLG